MARPRKDLDPARVEKLASFGLTDWEVARCLGCSQGLLRGRYAEALRSGRARLNVSLRRAQLLAARRGDTRALIWLGKQFLGQRDRQEVTTEHGSTLRVVERIEPDRPDVANGD